MMDQNPDMIHVVPLLLAVVLGLGAIVWQIFRSEDHRQRGHEGLHDTDLD